MASAKHTILVWVPPPCYLRARPIACLSCSLLYSTPLLTAQSTMALDIHARHCAACVRKKACSESSCPWEVCPNDCGALFHGCKEKEHLLLCSLQEVGCTNAAYGCTAHLRRANLRNHLAHCPASVVVCNFSWQRQSGSADLNTGKVVQSVSGGDREAPAYHLELLEADSELSRTGCDWEGDLDVRVYGRISGQSRYGCRPQSQHHHRQLRVGVEKDHYVNAEHFSRQPSEGETRLTFWCNSVVRRDEVEDHYHWHNTVHLGLDCSWLVHLCPLHTYGCQFAVERLLPLPLGSKVKLDSLHHAFTVDPTEVLDVSATNQEDRGSSYLAELQKKKELALYGYYSGEAMDPLSQLPSEVLVLVLGHLDSLSLLQLSQVSTHFRQLCSSLVRRRGVVEVEWQSIQRPDLYRRWKEADRKVC